MHPGSLAAYIDSIIMMQLLALRWRGSLVTDPNLGIGVGLRLRFFPRKN